MNGKGIRIRDLGGGISAWGIDRTVAHLNGMFAFDVVDTVGRRVFLVRDPHGIKPVYYQLKPRVVTFASEIKAILAVSGARWLERIASESSDVVRTQINSGYPQVFL